MTQIKVQPLGDSLVETESPSMTLDEHGEWFSVILSDKKFEAERILTTCNTLTRNTLLNGRFEPQQTRLLLRSCPCQEDGTRDATFSQAFHMAVAFGSIDVVTCFIQNGCDVLMVDDHGRNAIHCLIYMVFIQEDCEEQMLGVFKAIEKSVTSDTMERLLSQESNEGSRPLEYALHLGISKMALAILSSTHGFMSRLQIHGTSSTIWVDISEYEVTGDRRFKSPLMMFAQFDKNKIDNEYFKELFYSPVAQQWLDAKYKALRGFVFIWFLFRCCFCVIFQIGEHYLLEMEEKSGVWSSVNSRNLENGTTSACLGSPLQSHKTLGWFCVFYCFVHCSVQLVLDVVEWCHLMQNPAVRWMDKTPKGKKQTVVHIKFYKATQVLLYIAILVNFTLRLLRIRSSFHPTVLLDNLSHAFISIAFLWSLLIFFPFLHKIGHFTVVMQRLLETLVAFFFFFAFYTFWCSQIIFRVANHNQLTCLEEFDFVSGRLLYSTFLTMVHMLDFRNIRCEDKFTLYVMHVIYVFTVVIMLINFLVAMFSSTVNWVNNHQHFVVEVQKLIVLSIVEQRLSNFNVLEKYFRKYQSRFFQHRDGKLCLCTSFDSIHEELVENVSLSFLNVKKL